MFVDARALGPAHSRWDGDHQKHSAVVVENVRVIDARSVRVIAGSLLKIVQAEKLVKSCAWEIHGRESAVDVQEAMVGSGVIDVEAVGIAPIVDPDDLRLGGIGKILPRRKSSESPIGAIPPASTSITPEPTMASWTSTALSRPWISQAQLLTSFSA